MCTIDKMPKKMKNSYMEMGVMMVFSETFMLMGRRGSKCFTKMRNCIVAKTQMGGNHQIGCQQKIG